MRRPVNAGLLLVVAALAPSCNVVIGAEEPVIEEASPATALDSGTEDALTVDDPFDAERAATCGDGLIEGTEQCDDGNDVASDGCEACEVRCGPAPELLVPETWQCYRFGSSAEAKTWDQAGASCAAWGGSLLSIATLDEFIVLQSGARSDGWTSARLNPSSGALEWPSGEAVEQSPWAGTLEGTGDCVAFSAGAAKLTRLPCTTPIGYVCERAPAGVRPE